MAVSSKVSARISQGLKRFQPILESAKSRDVNESDTVVIVTDMLQEVFGYDKYAEITSEHSIRSTFCDLAIHLDGALELLVEVKAIGLELKDSFVKQAIDYAANQGCDWVLLTNGIIWRAYKVAFTKPIEHEMVLEFNILQLVPKNEDHIETVSLIAKEGWQRNHLTDYHTQRQALSKYCLAALILSDTVLDVLRRELRRMAPGVKVESEEIRKVLEADVVKRDILEGDKAIAAKKAIAKAANKALRASKKANESENDEQPEVVNSAPEPESPCAVTNGTNGDG